MSPILRQWSLLVSLSSRRQGMTIREIAAEFGVTQRTVLRDLAALQQVGFPLNEAKSAHGRKHWKLGDDPAAIPLRFTWDEAIALFLARRHLEPLAGTQLWESAQRAIRKIRATLNEPALRYLEKMSALFHRTTTSAGDYAEKGEMIDRLMIGIEDHRITFIEYQSNRSTEPVTYEIYPYGIAFHRNSLYLVAHSVNHGELRHFKIDRLESVAVESLKFVPPDDFDLQQHFADSFGIFHGNGQPTRVRIHFAAEVARYVEESNWHPSQSLTHHRDGSLLFEVRLSSLEEVKSWVLSFGRHAEVLEPAGLREEMAEEVAAMLDGYAKTLPKEGQVESDEN